MEDIFKSMGLLNPKDPDVLDALEKIEAEITYKPTQYAKEYPTLNEAVQDARKLDHVSHIMNWGGKFYISTVQDHSICTVDPGHKEMIMNDFNRPDNGTV